MWRLTVGGCPGVAKIAVWFLGCLQEDCLEKGKGRETCRHQKLKKKERMIRRGKIKGRQIKRQPWSILHGHFNSESKSSSVFEGICDSAQLHLELVNTN